MLKSSQMRKKMKERIRYLLLLSAVFLTAAAGAQTKLNGKVIDSRTRLPIAYASISLKGSTNGSVTKEDGSFEIVTYKALPATLIVQNVGYERREVEVRELPVTIELTETSQALQEVVVIGYGTQKKSDITGSISTLPAQALKQPISSFDRALQGVVAGVQVTSVAGQPGAAVSIRIRGGNSINGSNEPLYVIDGFPVYNSNSDADAGVTTGPNINALSTLNPADIESIDILKDASATAIYGSRGANGVVIITTKKGKAGQHSFTYDGYYGVQDVVRTIPLLNAQQWALLKNDARLDSGKQPAFTQAQIDSLGQPGAGTDWQRAAFRTAPIQSHNLSFTGGDDKTRFAVSGNYFKQDGVLANTDFERYSFRINMDRTFTSKFKLGTNLTGSKTKAQVAPAGVVGNLLQMPPTVPLYDATGNYTLRSIYDTPLGNPIATLNRQLNETVSYRGFGNAYGEYQLAEGLTARISAGIDALVTKQNRYLPSTLYEGASYNGLGSIGTKFAIGWLNENTLSYRKSLGANHQLDAVVGYTQQTSTTENTVASASNFVTDAFQHNNLGAGTTLQTPSSNAFSWALQSFLGRVNYTFRNKYHFTVSARADGSSRLGKNHKWGYFPSAAFSWNVNREEFIKALPQISNLKFRVSAGVTGNQEITPYSSLAQESYYSYIIGNTLVAGYAPSGVANPDLKWESTSQYDAGIDLGLLKNRISITLDAYYKVTRDLLLNVPLPYTTGYSSALQNFGKAENKGIELSLNTVNFEGKFNWTSAFVFSANRNKVLSLGPGVTSIISDPSLARVGEALGSFYVYKTNGIFQLTDDVASLPRLSAKDKAGSQRYVDVNGDGTITQANDRVIVGNAQPKFIVGLTNTFNYKNFDLTFLFQGQYGNKVYNVNKANLELGTGYIGASTTMLDRWTPTNPSNTIHRAIEEPAIVISDRFIEDGSYLRLKNISLGYSLPSSLTSLLKVKQVRFYVSGQNLATWTNYTGYDPEVSSNGQSSLTPGVDNAVYPNSKTVLGGLTVTF
jgi:TonB-linked SusC/RagA family outer membrane protein